MAVSQYSHLLFWFPDCWLVQFKLLVPLVWQLLHY